MSLNDILANTPQKGSDMSEDYDAEFDCTPAQYHAAIDKLWKALEVTGPQGDDCFTLAAREIVRLRNRVKEAEVERLTERNEFLSRQVCELGHEIRRLRRILGERGQEESP